MTNIVLARQITGTRNGLAWPAPGTEIDLDESEAKQLVLNGDAVYPKDTDGVHIAKGGTIFTDEQLAGAPSGRDVTLGQQDTNFARAKFLAQPGNENLAREAADRLGLNDTPEDEEPKVGDQKEATGFRDDGVQTVGPTDNVDVETSRKAEPVETASISNEPTRRSRKTAGPSV